MFEILYCFDIICFLLDPETAILKGKVFNHCIRNYNNQFSYKITASNVIQYKGGLEAIFLPTFTKRRKSSYFVIAV
ncbi:hypothetical protein TNCT_237881 [Trichonephila clavata]|uniref:Uncharacterized protein n=1 Tax=Trichonephila clavata TaxID=2740835 RepID=A0A8X6LGP4_TRICU|nr:hypothetical protein TNCT_237881 [Trichonephila clavata]